MKSKLEMLQELADVLHIFVDEGKTVEENWDSVIGVVKRVTEKATGKPTTIDCSTCKHRRVSGYVEPCFSCTENDTYENYEAKTSEFNKG